MYPVTQNFMDKVRADLRQVHARVTIDWTSPDTDQSITISASENAHASYPSQTADGVSEVAHKWASLDGSWILDGTWHLAPEPDDLTLYQMGWWGLQLAGEGGAFAEPYPALTITHLPRPIRSLRVDGDSARGEYPVDFTIQLYAQDNTLLHTETVTGNTLVSWSKILTTPVMDVAKQVLTITKWSHPGRQAKILEFFTSIQETYEDDGIIELNLLEEREADQGSLPVGNITANELSLRLPNENDIFSSDNPASPFWGLLRPNRRIYAWLGIDDEWVPLGVFWSTNWETSDNIIGAMVKARDRLELLRKTTYRTGTMQQNVSLYALADQVLQDAGLLPAQYWIDTALQSIVVPWGWIPITSHREALRIIAEAGLAVVYADRDGVIRIRNMSSYASGEPSEFELGWPDDKLYDDDQLYDDDASWEDAEPAVEFAAWLLGEPQIVPCLEITADDYFPPLSTPSRQDDVANEIVVATVSYYQTATAEEVYRSSTPINVPAGQTVTVTVEYSKTPVTDASASLISPPAGVSITAATYYVWGADVTIQNTSATAANVTLVVSGKPFEAKGGEHAVARDQTSIWENGLLRYEFPENHLIQTLAQAQAIANALLASYKDPRRDIEVEWRGNPALELGDRVMIVGQDVHVIRQEFNWAGAFSAQFTGRRV